MLIIGFVAGRSGLAVFAIRYYELEGLIIFELNAASNAQTSDRSALFGLRSCLGFHC